MRDNPDAYEESEPVNEESEPVNEESEPVNEESEPVNEESEPVNEESEPILMETAAIVEHANQAIKSERWLKRIERSLRRLGVTSIVGRDFVYLDEETAEVRFGEVPLHRLSMFCNRLEDLAVLADDYPTRVPAPMVGGTNVWIETLHVQLNIFDTPDPTHD